MSGELILIVEDNEKNRTLVRDVLQSRATARMRSTSSSKRRPDAYLRRLA